MKYKLWSCKCNILPQVLTYFIHIYTCSYCIYIHYSISTQVYVPKISYILSKSYLIGLLHTVLYVMTSIHGKCG